MRTLSILVFCLCLLSCNQNTVMNEMPEGSVTTKDVENNIAHALRSFDAFNAHDWEKHASHFSDSCMYLDPSYGNYYKMVNRKDKAAKYKEMQDWSPDIKDSIIQTFGSGNKVTVQFISMGTAQTKDGAKKWSLPICCVFTFKNGLIVCDETYYDR